MRKIWMRHAAADSAARTIGPVTSRFASTSFCAGATFARAAHECTYSAQFLLWPFFKCRIPESASKACCSNSPPIFENDFKKNALKIRSQSLVALRLAVAKACGLPRYESLNTALPVEWRNDE